MRARDRFYLYTLCVCSRVTERGRKRVSARTSEGDIEMKKKTTKHTEILNTCRRLNTAIFVLVVVYYCFSSMLCLSVAGNEYSVAMQIDMIRHVLNNTELCHYLQRWHALDHICECVCVFAVMTNDNNRSNDNTSDGVDSSNR